jgi:hypothetical protein
MTRKYFKKIRSFFVCHLGILFSLFLIALGSVFAFVFYFYIHDPITSIQYLVGCWPAGLSFYIMQKVPHSSKRAKSKITSLRPAFVGLLSYVVTFFVIWKTRYIYQPPVDLYDEVFFVGRLIPSSLALSFFLQGL